MAELIGRALTFQQRYRVDEHPVIPGVTDKSWMHVEYPNWVEAKPVVWLAIDEGNWSFDYPVEEMPEQEQDYGLVQLPWKLAPSTGYANQLVWWERVASAWVERCLITTTPRQFHAAAVL